jgi:hypothetical protein
MQIAQVTPNEMLILEFLREARPYEKIVIQKDNHGKLDNYIITREQKVILTTIAIKPAK